MSISVQNLVDFARSHNKLIPIVGIGGVSNEPALTFANKTKKRIISQTLNWDWNRASEPSFVTSTSNVEDYTPNSAADIYWIERAFAELESDTSTPKYRYPLAVKRDLPRNWTKSDPKQIALVYDSAGALKYRLTPMPSSTVWRIYVEYQKVPTTLTALSGAGGTFDPIPDTMQDVLTQFFLAFAYKMVDKSIHLQELAEAERLLSEYRASHIVEESEVGFYPDFDLFLG